MPDAALIEICQTPDHGPEDILPLPDGGFLASLSSGAIARIEADFATCSIMANTRGRPLGMEILDPQSVVICDGIAGLLRLDLDSAQITPLVQDSTAQPLRFCNNCAVAVDGTIYFSNSTTRFGMSEADKDIIEGIGTGALYQRTAGGVVSQLMGDLFFANGVVLSPDEEFVLCAETGRARISRYWLKGPKAGTRDVFLDQLPGMPDNLNVGTDGLIWTALVMPMTPSVSKIWDAPLWLRKIVARLPDWITPTPNQTLMVAAYDWQGREVFRMAPKDAAYTFVTSVRNVDGMLYLASIRQMGVARLRMAS